MRENGENKRDEREKKWVWKCATWHVLIGGSFSTFGIKCFLFFFSKFCGEDTCLNLPWEFSTFVLCIDAFEGMRFKWIWNKSTNAIRRGRKENEHQYEMHRIMDENSTLQTIKPDENQYQRNLRIEWEAEKKRY